MKDAIVYSTWDWGIFGSPERVALALAQRGYLVLYCEMAVSRIRGRGSLLREVSPGIHAFRPEYLGKKLEGIPLIGNRQWKMVARQIQEQANSLGMEQPLFFYSHVKGLERLCSEMRAHVSQLVHLCVDYPEPYQYSLVQVSDRTLVIPTTVFHKLRARYGEKIELIPQSIHLPDNFDKQRTPSLTRELANVPHPRLGYLGPIHARVNLVLTHSLLRARPDWHFVCFGDSSIPPLPNVHVLPWRPANEMPALVEEFDVGLMPYDVFEEKNLHCVPLKLFDYFLAGLPVVSTPVLSLTEYSDLIYFGDTAPEFARAVEKALAEPTTSPKRQKRSEVARAHSTEALGERLEELLKSGPGKRTPA